VPRKLPLVAAVTAASMAAVPAAASAKTIIGSGSSVAEPYLQVLFKGYKKQHPKVHFVYTSDGGNAGVKDVQQKRSQFAVNTRPPIKTDHGTLYSKLFLDGLCIDVNPANKLKKVSIKQARDIFLGTKTNWSQVSGSNLKTQILPFGRDATAGTYTFFQDAVLNGATQSQTVTPLDKDGLVANAVKKNHDAIGYVGLAHSGKGSGVKRLKLNGRSCAPKDIKSLKYPLSRYIWFVLPLHKANKDAAKFADWVRTSKAAGKIIAKAGAVPAFNKK
jgi:phosphate transport system substrate-binding protein